MTAAAQTEWLNAIPAAIFVFQNESVAFANPAAGALVGCSPDELTGTPYASLFLDSAQAGGFSRLQRRTGSPLSVELTRAEIDFGGAPAQIITALQHDPAKLYRAAIVGSIDSFFLARLDRDAENKVIDVVVVDASERGIQQTRVPRDQVIGLSLTELYPLATYGSLLEGFALVIASGQAFSKELFISNRVVIDGWYHVQLVPLENDHVAVFLRDIA
ncbi:MAG: PAS domain-containing protein, partial [Chloroflexota bacterium]